MSVNNKIKTESETSLKSLGMGSTLKAIKSSETSLFKRLTPEGGLQPAESVYDCIAYIIHCPIHKKVALSCVERAKAVWLPFIVCPSNKTWKDASADGISIILAEEHAELDKTMQKKIPIKFIELLHILRIQLSHEKFVTRLIQFVNLDQRSDFKCCSDTKRIRWFPLNKIIIEDIENLWGPEVQLFSKSIQNLDPKGINEISQENMLQFMPKKPPQNAEEEMFESLGIIRKDMEIFFEDYLEHCFPSFYMSRHSFNCYLTKIGHEGDESLVKLLFNAFSYKKNNYLEFNEVLLGLASMESKTLHKEGRAKFVFRYYDINRDGNLNEKEFRNMVKDIDPTADESVIKTKFKEGMKDMGSEDGKIFFKDFFQAVGSLKFRGTSNLCRSKKSLLSNISKSMISRSESRANVKSNAKAFLKTNRRNKGICYACKGKKYDYGLHTVRFDTNGRCVEPRIRPGMNLEGQEQSDPNWYSIEYVFRTNSFPNTYIDMIREFQKNKEKSKAKTFGSYADDRETFIKYFERFCSDLENIFTAEERVVKINSPVCIIGDIYGNLDDLMKMETMLWQSFPLISANYVFLGNYVDFGKWGFESVVYLLSLKLVAPKKISLLRGLHEIRETQKKQSFYNECIERFGQKYGLKTWELINGLFDKLPLSVIIDESLFCANSGIPKTKSISKITEINSDLTDPEKDSGIAWQLMVNRPATEPMKSNFTPNPKTKMGYLFTADAVNEFLTNNGLTHIICSNDLSQTGYKIYFNGKFSTICSNFAQNNNQTAVVFVDNEKLRFIRLD